MEDSIRVITANHQPFRLVLREEDSWAPTLEQINSRTYDYVKLHRMSTYLDVGISPFSIGVCFDGTLILPATEEFIDRSNALARFNQTLAEMLIGGLYCEAVTPDDIGYGELSFNAYSKITGGARGPSGSFHQAARTKHIGALDVIALFSPEKIKAVALQDALAKGRELLGKLGQIPQEQLLYGATFYVRKQWAESLIHTWTTIERIVEIAWQKRVVSSLESPSKARRNFLEDHRTWPVSAKLEVLFQKSLLPKVILDSLDLVRKARNDFAHRGVQPSHVVATAALESCFKLASLCASNFVDDTLFDDVALLVVNRCKPELLPKEREIKGVSHWLGMPPLPGEKEWGDQPYEIIEELTLKPIEPPKGSKKVRKKPA